MKSKIGNLLAPVTVIVGVVRKLKLKNKDKNHQFLLLGGSTFLSCVFHFSIVNFVK
jgi:hypothetical protein